MNLSLYKLRKRLNNSGQGSLTAVALGGVLLSTLVASATSWYITMRNNIGNTEDKLEAQTIAISEWERLSHMSLDELEAKRSELAKPYSAGTGSQYQVSVNLGQKGTFNNGTCGAVSGGYANCFKDTTITVYRDGNRMFTTRTLPLMAGDYTRKEIDDLLANIKNDYISRDNNLRTDYTNKYNTLANRLNGKEFVKNKTTNYDLNLRYEKKAGEDKFSLHAYNGNTEIPFAQGENPSPSLFSDQGGYYKFDNGLIMQWGKDRAYADVLHKIYFPIPFPHKVLCINLTGQNDLLSGADMDNSSPLVGNTFTNTYFYANTDGLPYVRQMDNFYWFAIGY